MTEWLTRLHASDPWLPAYVCVFAAVAAVTLGAAVVTLLAQKRRP